MAEQVSASKRVQIGYEQTAGTAVPATTKFHGLDIQLAMNPEMQTIRSKGSRFPKGAYRNREWSKLTLSGVPDYNELTYVFESVFKKVSATGASTAKTRQIVPSTDSQDTHASYTVEMGDADRAWQAAYGILNQFKLSLTRKSCALSGGGFAKAAVDDFAITSTGVSELPMALILPEQWSVYLADSWAGLASASEMDRVFSASVETPEAVGMIWPLKRSAASFDGVIDNTLENMLFRLLVATDSEGMSPLTAMRSQGVLKYIKVNAIGEEISTGVYYMLSFSSPVSVKGISEFKDSDGVFATEWMLEAADDNAYQFTVDLINTVPTIAAEG